MHLVPNPESVRHDSLHGSARDEEPLVDAWVNGGGCLVVTLGDVELGSLSAVGRVSNGSVGTVKPLASSSHPIL